MRILCVCVSCLFSLLKIIIYCLSKIHTLKHQCPSGILSMTVHGLHRKTIFKVLKKKALKQAKLETKIYEDSGTYMYRNSFGGHMFFFVIQMCRKNKYLRNQLQRIPCKLMHIKSFNHKKNLE